MPQERKHASAAHRQAAYRVRLEQARQMELASKGLPALPAIPSMPGWPRWRASFVSTHALLTATLSEMQDYFDARSESWQESERGDTHQEKMASLEAVLDALSDLTS